MSTLSSRLYDRAERMESGRHKGGIKVETVRAMAEEAEDLERRVNHMEDLNERLQQQLSDSQAATRAGQEVMEL